MPKQNIYDADYRREFPVYTDGEISKDSLEFQVFTTNFLTIGWSKEHENVQVSVRSDEDPDGFEAKHMSLDRSGCNALIKHIRKARDDAFGRDE